MLYIYHPYPGGTVRQNFRSCLHRPWKTNEISFLLNRPLENRMTPPCLHRPRGSKTKFSLPSPAKGKQRKISSLPQPAKGKQNDSPLPSPAKGKQNKILLAFTGQGKPEQDPPCLNRPRENRAKSSLPQPAKGKQSKISSLP